MCIRDKHNHSEMDAALKGYMDAVIKSPKLTTAWLAGVKGILDAYLGKIPENFSYEGKTYTPVSFMKEIGINPDDYVVFTSFSHHPLYKQCVLELSLIHISEPTRLGMISYAVF